MKLSLAANLVLNWVCPVLYFFERFQPIAAAMCTVTINVLEPGAFNPESQYFIPLFNKISWLCRTTAKRGWSIKWGVQLICYTHGVSPAELSRNARPGNDDVVAERLGCCARSFHRPATLPLVFLFSFSSPYLGYSYLFVFFGLVKHMVMWWGLGSFIFFSWSPIY